MHMEHILPESSVLLKAGNPVQSASTRKGQKPDITVKFAETLNKQ